MHATSTWRLGALSDRSARPTLCASHLGPSPALNRLSTLAARERAHILRVEVGLEGPVCVHKKVAIILDEKLVVHVVVSRRAEANLTEHRLCRKQGGWLGLRIGRGRKRGEGGTEEKCDHGGEGFNIMLEEIIHVHPRGGGIRCE